MSGEPSILFTGVAPPGESFYGHTFLHGQNIAKDNNNNDNTRNSGSDSVHPADKEDHASTTTTLNNLRSVGEVYYTEN